MKKTKQKVRSVAVDLNSALKSELQSLLHKHGSDKFMFALTRACFSASNDTEDFVNRSISARYNYYGNEIWQLIENCPTFLGDENE